MIVKKSSYCWFLDECNGKISTDRLQRFVTGNKINKRTKKYTKIQSKKKQKYPQVSSFSEEDQICKEAKEYFNDLRVCNTSVPEIILEKYAVFYDNNYYIGRIVELCNNNQVKIKFLKSELDSFIWPREDVTYVETKYIFYGPIELVGTGPFVLRHSDRDNIHKRYKLRKREEL